MYDLLFFSEELVLKCHLLHDYEWKKNRDSYKKSKEGNLI